MPPKSAPLHQVVEQSIQAENTKELTRPETIVWAKLRGYPWWPGRVKGPGQCPSELSHIAKVQYKPGTVVAVYFFGSHDFSLVPVESLRPLDANWDLFCSRSSSSRFSQALIEAKNPEKYKKLELAALGTSKPAMVPSPRVTPGIVIAKKRGRPPKHARLEVVKSSASEKSHHKGKKKKSLIKFGINGMITREYVYYCRVKLQKMLLRPEVKDMEMPLAIRIIAALSSDPMTIDAIKSTKIGVVLYKAVKRSEFKPAGQYSEIGSQMTVLLADWRQLAERFIKEMGL